MKQKQFKNGLGINIKGLQQKRRSDAPLVPAQERSPWGDDGSSSSEEEIRDKPQPAATKVKFEYHSEEEQQQQVVAEQPGHSNVVEAVQEVLVVAEDHQAENAADDRVEAVKNLDENYLADFEFLGLRDLSASEQYNSKFAPNRQNKVTFAPHLADTFSVVKLNNLKAVKYLATLVADDMEIAVREKLFKKFPTILNELNMTHAQHIDQLVCLCKNNGKICSDVVSSFAKQELITYLMQGDLVAREQAAKIVGFDVNQHFLPQNNAPFNALLAIAEQISKDYKHKIKPGVLKHVIQAIQTLGKGGCDVYRACVAQVFLPCIRENLVTFCERSKSKRDYNFTNVKKYSDTLKELLQDDIFRAEITVDNEEQVGEFDM